MLTKILLPALAVTALAYAESPFACNRLALSPEARVRHFEEVSPALRQLHQTIRELPDGYEFEFAPTATTYQLLSEWTSREYLCCPFFDIDLRISREGGVFLAAADRARGNKT